MHMKIKLLGLLLSISLLLCGCTGNATGRDNSEEAVKETQNVFAMNTYITLTAYGENVESALTDSENRIRELEKLLSVTDEGSEIYMVNHSGGAATALSPDTENVISFALKMANKTNGALEPTISPVLTAWRFTTESYQIPTQETIDRLCSQSDLKRFRYKTICFSFQMGCSLIWVRWQRVMPVMKL